MTPFQCITKAPQVARSQHDRKQTKAVLQTKKLDNDTL
jgi:hypothetical protein